MSAKDLSADVRELLTKLVLDWAGAAIGGGAYAESTQLCSAPKRTMPAGTGTVAGQAQHYPLGDSAFLNGTFAHSLEFDDT